MATGPGLPGKQDTQVSVPSCAHLCVHSLILHLTAPGSSDDDEDEDQWRRRTGRRGPSSVPGVGGRHWC